MELSQYQIEKINKACLDAYNSNQGVYFQPTGVPVRIKELVIYTRYETGGYSGGSCWGSSNPQPFSTDPPNDKFKVLDMVLEELMPNITYLQFKKIDALIHSEEESENEYYGNCTDYKVEYIILSELCKLLETFIR